MACRMNKLQSGDVSLLTDARREYAEVMAGVVRRDVLDTLDKMYTSNPELPKSQRLVNFQRQLRGIQRWNQAIVELHTNTISNDFPFFTALLSAVFVSYCRVLLLLHQGTASDKIKVQVPTNTRFVHEMYVNIGERFYGDPSLYREDDLVKTEIILKAIQRTVRALMPVKEVLQIYLGSAITADGDLTPALNISDEPAFAPPQSPPRAEYVEPPEYAAPVEETLELDIGTPPPPPPVPSVVETHDEEGDRPRGDDEDRFRQLDEEGAPTRHRDDTDRMIEEATKRVEDGGMADELPLRFFDGHADDER